MLQALLAMLIPNSNSKLSQNSMRIHCSSFIAYHNVFWMMAQGKKKRQHHLPYVWFAFGLPEWNSVQCLPVHVERFNSYENPVANSKTMKNIVRWEREGKRDGERERERER